MALVNRGYPDAMFELANLLSDPERDVRRAAADAIVVSGDAHAGIPLLVLRIRASEGKPEVLGACFAGISSLGKGHAFDFVVEHLHAHDPLVIEAAALALGQERPHGALPALLEFAERSFGDTRRVAMLAISMLRSEGAWIYLLDHIIDGLGIVAHLPRERADSLAHGDR